MTKRLSKLLDLDFSKVLISLSVVIFMIVQGMSACDSGIPRLSKSSLSEIDC